MGRSGNRASHCGGNDLHAGGCRASTPLGIGELIAHRVSGSSGFARVSVARLANASLCFSQAHHHRIRLVIVGGGLAVGGLSLCWRLLFLRVADGEFRLGRRRGCNLGRDPGGVDLATRDVTTTCMDALELVGLGSCALAGDPFCSAQLASPVGDDAMAFMGHGRLCGELGRPLGNRTTTCRHGAARFWE